MIYHPRDNLANSTAAGVIQSKRARPPVRQKIPVDFGLISASQYDDQVQHAEVPNFPAVMLSEELEEMGT
jgi:hypothetical protein